MTTNIIKQLTDPQGFSPDPLTDLLQSGAQRLIEQAVEAELSVLLETKSLPERASKWLTSLLERKPARVATVAMANKTARIVWAVLTRNEPYTPHTA